MPALRIAICGGGIGGLMLALVVKKFSDSKDIVVDVYEAGDKFTELGAGISAWERTRSIFRTLGIAETLDSSAVHNTLRFRKADGSQPINFHELSVPHGQAGLPRTELLNLILQHLAPQSTAFITTHFSKRIVSYEQDIDGVTLQFADGSAAHADVLVGADGLGSPTRKRMYADLAARVRGADPEKADALLKASQPSWTGTYVYRSLIERAKLRAVAPGNVMIDQAWIWCGKDKHAVTYPISDTHTNVLYFDTVRGGLGQPLTGPSMAAASKEEIVELFKDWDEDLRVGAENVGKTAKWAISQIRGLPHYADVRVALLGDSAHAMSTHLAAGAGQAIEDAYILGRLLTHPSVSASNIHEALEVYDAIRRPIGNDVVERSLRLRFLYELDPDWVPAGTDVAKLHAGDLAELQKLGREIDEIYSFHYRTMPEADWERAKEMLEGKLAQAFQVEASHL